MQSIPHDPPQAGVEVTRPYQDHYAQLYYRVLDDEQVTNRGLAAYVALARFADWQTGVLRVSRAKLAKVGRVSVKTIDRGVTELVDLGYVAVERTQRDDGSWAASSYQLLDTAAAALARGGDSQSPGDSDSGTPPRDSQSRGVGPHSPEGGDSGATQEQTSSNKRQINEHPPVAPGTQLQLVGGSEATADKSAAGRRQRKPRTFMTEDWLPPKEAADTIAAELGVTRQQLAAWLPEFRDYWIGEGKSKADWVATWRNRMRERAARGDTLPGRPGGTTGTPRTTQRVQSALALAEKYDAMEAGQ